MLQCLQIPAIPSKIRTIYAAIVGLEIISVRAGCTCKKHDGKICGKHGNCMDRELCAWTLQKTVANWGVMHSGNSVLPQENQMTPVYHLPFFLHFVWTVSDWISEYLYNTEIIKWPWAHRAGQGLLGVHLTQVCFGMVALIPSAYKRFTDQ